MRLQYASFTNRREHNSECYSKCCSSAYEAVSVYRAQEAMQLFACVDNIELYLHLGACLQEGSSLHLVGKKARLLFSCLSLSNPDTLSPFLYCSSYINGKPFWHCLVFKVKFIHLSFVWGVYMWRSENNFGDYFSPSTTWILGIKMQVSHLCSKHFADRIISLDLVSVLMPLHCLQTRNPQG